jgi:hypothetical protein
MTKRTGLWIDHRQAVVVSVVDGVETTVVLTSHVDRRDQPHNHADEDSLDRRFHGHLDGFYDRVIAAAHDSESLLIMGPGEAKGELRKRIEAKGHMKGPVVVETADKMSVGQVEAKVRAALAPAAEAGGGV